MLIPLGFLAASSGGVPQAMELISTTVVPAGGASTVTFSNLNTYASTYKHLQIRAVARSDRATYSHDYTRIFLNNDNTQGNYYNHNLEGNGGSVVSSAVNGAADIANVVSRLTSTGSQTGAFNGMVLDILDAYSTTKLKTLRSFSGQESQDAGGFGGRFVNIYSVLWNSQNAISTITLDQRFGSNFTEFSRFSIYGVK